MMKLLHFNHYFYTAVNASIYPLEVQITLEALILFIFSQTVFSPFGRAALTVSIPTSTVNSVASSPISPLLVQVPVLFDPKEMQKVLLVFNVLTLLCIERKEDCV